MVLVAEATTWGVRVIKGISRNSLRLMSVCTVGLLSMPFASFGQESTDGVAPIGSASRIASEPVIDGNVLDDPAWRGVVPMTEFWQTQPNAGAPASQRTAVYVAYSDTALLIGLVAYDDDPSAIISTDSRRDSSLDDTDSFRVMIDGQLDRQNGYVFGTNPAGIEFDGQVSREGSGVFIFGGDGGLNLNWDAPWTVRSKIGDFGWSAEMEIPFTSLRFGQGAEQEWGFNFERRIRRNNEVSYWAKMGQQRDILRVSEAGSIRNIVVPVQRNLQVTPYVLGIAERGGALSGTESDFEFGVDAKYSITPSLTLDLTLNTDFAQVEADDQQVNLDRFSLFFPEKRPFFLENSGQFTVGHPREAELFFSRRIGIGAGGVPTPIDGGARLSGKIGDTTNVGLLFMQSEGVAGVASENQYAVVRVNQELANRSSVGFLVVNRDGDGSLLGNGSDDQNQTYALDGRWGIGDNGLVSAWAAKTETPGLTGRDDAFGVSHDFNNADWSTSLGYAQVGADFNPEVGFLSRSAYRKVTGRILRRIRPKDLWNLFEIRPHISGNGFWDFDGFQETGFVHIDNHWEFETGTEIHTGMNITKSGVKAPFDIIPGTTIQPGTYDHNEAMLRLIGDQSKPFNFSMLAIIGGRFGGDRLTLQPAINYRIGDKFSSELTYNYNDFDLPVPNGKFTANLMRLRLSYSFTPQVLLQLLTQYNEVSDTVSNNLRFSWLRSANSGLFLVYNEVDDQGLGALPRGREFIVKYSHIFDVLN